MSTYNNTDDSFNTFQKLTLVDGTYTYSYNNLTSSFDSRFTDQEQLLVVRKFNLLTAGLSKSNISSDIIWDLFTLPNSVSSGSSMYTIDTTAKTITMLTDTSLYSTSVTWDDGITTTESLPVFNPTTDELYIMRKTYGVTPFVTWQSGSRFTADQLNKEVTQLLNLTQEAIDKFNNFPTLTPYYGQPGGICPLTSAGKIAPEYIDSSTISNALLGISVIAGSGLSGGGDLDNDQNVTLNLSLPSSITTAGGLTVSSDELILDIDSYDLEVHSHDSITDKLGVKFSNDSLARVSTGIYVDVVDGLSSTSATKALSANQGKVLKDTVDAATAGTRYLGSLELWSQGSATFTLSDKPNEASTITLTDSDGTALVFEIDADNNGTAGSNVAVVVPGSGGGGTAGQRTASQLATVINAQAASFDMTASAPGDVDGQITITQGTGGSDGNKTISVNDSSHWNSVCSTNVPSAFTGGANGSAFPAAPASGGSYLNGDTYDVIRNATETTASSGTLADSNSTLQSVSTGDDIRYNSSSVWYTIPETLILDTSNFARVDGTSVMTSAWSWNDKRITNLGTPTESADAATKNYVDTSTTRTLTLLNDVTISTAATDNVLKYSGSSWVNAPLNLDHLNDVNVSTPAEGQLLTYDSSSAKWTNGGSSVNPQTFTFTGDGSTTVFTFSSASNSSESRTYIVSIDGVLQKAVTDYTCTTAQITFSTAPPTSSEIYIMNFGINRNVDSLAAGAVTTAMLADDAVTLAKISTATAGSIFIWNASTNPEALVPSDTGKVLTSKGTGAIPAWEYPNSGANPKDLVDQFTDRYTLDTDGRLFLEGNYIYRVAKFKDGNWKAWGWMSRGAGVNASSTPTENKFFTRPQNIYYSQFTTDDGSTLTDTAAKPIKKVHTVSGVGEFIIDGDDKLYLAGYHGGQFGTTTNINYVDTSLTYNRRLWHITGADWGLNGVAVSKIYPISAQLSPNQGQQYQNSLYGLFVIDTSGNCWGAAKQHGGGLGTGTTSSQQNFVKVWDVSSRGTTCVSVASGVREYHANRTANDDKMTSYLLDSNEDLYATGYGTNDYGGNGTNGTRSSWTKLVFGTETNAKVKSFAYIFGDSSFDGTSDGEKLKSLSCAAIITADGHSNRRLYTWGINSSGQGGNNNSSVLAVPKYIAQVIVDGSAVGGLLQNVQKIWFTGDGRFTRMYVTDTRPADSKTILYACGYQGGTTYGSPLGVPNSTATIKQLHEVIIEGKKAGDSWGSGLSDMTIDNVYSVDTIGWALGTYITAKDSEGNYRIFSRSEARRYTTNNYGSSGEFARSSAFRGNFGEDTVELWDDVHGESSTYKGFVQAWQPAAVDITKGLGIANYFPVGTAMQNIASLYFCGSDGVLYGAGNNRYSQIPQYFWDYSVSTNITHKSVPMFSNAL